MGAVATDFVEGLDENHPGNLYRILAERFDLDAYTRERFERTSTPARGERSSWRNSWVPMRSGVCPAPEYTTTTRSAWRGPYASCALKWAGE